MKGRTLAIVGAILICAAMLSAQTPITLPKPAMEGGKPLMTCLKERHTSREFSPEALPLPIVSNLLWAAFGINRPENDHRTAPSAMNWQEDDLYVFDAKGVYLYDAKTHALKPVLDSDHRKDAGMQDFVKDAPLTLIYVADHSKMLNYTTKEPLPVDDQRFYSGADVGFIAENVYLFCASENLSCVVRGYVDKEALHKLLNLKPEQKVLLGQTVGYPKK